MRAGTRSGRSVTFGGVVGRLLAVVFALFLVLAAYFVARGFGLYQDALAAKSLDEMAASIEGREGFTPIDQLPDIYLQAVVAVEDHRFYAHPGFDVIATGRALVNDIKAGAIVEGGSTITQQLAKNQFFTQEQTLERKVAEVFMAFTMERHFSKREILELYVNSIYFGEGYEGIGEASQGYFGKAPSDLTDYEATLLAGIPNAPSAYALTQNPDLARQRQSQCSKSWWPTTTCPSRTPSASAPSMPPPPAGTAAAGCACRSLSRQGAGGDVRIGTDGRRAGRDRRAARSRKQAPAGGVRHGAPPVPPAGSPRRAAAHPKPPFRESRLPLTRLRTRR